MDQRKWEELPQSCLVQVFQRVWFISRLESLPFVCKSWYKATLKPQCWQYINFTENPKLNPRLTAKDGGPPPYQTKMEIVEACIKFVIARSQGSAEYVAFMPLIKLTQEVLNYLADVCPSLKYLVVPQITRYNRGIEVSSLLCKWKCLEAFDISKGHDLIEAIIQISLHCKNLRSLYAHSFDITKDVASTIVTRLPNIKALHLSDSSIDRKNLLIILNDCKKLEFFSAWSCKGYKEDDAEILKAASHIAYFDCKAATDIDIFNIECIYPFVDPDSEEEEPPPTSYWRP